MRTRLWIQKYMDSNLKWPWEWALVWVLWAVASGGVESGEPVSGREAGREAGCERSAPAEKKLDYTLLLDPGWEKVSKEKPLVISVPGMGSTGTPIEKVLVLAREEGFACGRFLFPHEPIYQSGRRLAQALQDLRRKDPNRRVALVTYSLGGVIARVAIEDPQLDPGNVRALIMLCPPNHGSLLLKMVPWNEHEKEPAEAPTEQNTPAAKSGAETAKNSPQGLAAVWADLRPGSSFLTRLNSRPRNPKVRYTILLGDRAYLDPEDRESLSKWAAQVPRPSGIGSDKDTIDQWIGQLDEVVHGRGDGAVSIARGRLENVDDVHIFHFSHVSLLRTDWNSPEVLRARQLIVDRLRSCPP